MKILTFSKNSSFDLCVKTTEYIFLLEMKQG
jgi:hypothetical protein